MEWCRITLRSAERETLRRRLSSITGITSDSRKSREMLRRVDAGSGYCEPFWFYPRRFDRIVTVAPSSFKREDIVDVMNEFSYRDLNIFSPARGSEEYTRVIGDITLEVEVDLTLARGFTVKQTDRFGDRSITKRWSNHTRRQRMLVKEVLTYIQDNRSTVIDSATSNVGQLKHSKGWVGMINQIFNDRVPIYASYEYTVAGVVTCRDQLNYYV
jgi:hypothetical protein